MKLVLSLVVVLAVLATGCGGPKASDPKVSGAKEDPRIKRAGPGGGSESQPAAFKKFEGKGAQ